MNSCLWEIFRRDIRACCRAKCEDWRSRCLWEGFLPVETLLYRYYVIMSFPSESLDSLATFVGFYLFYDASRNLISIQWTVHNAYIIHALLTWIGCMDSMRSLSLMISLISYLYHGLTCSSSNQGPFSLCSYLMRELILKNVRDLYQTPYVVFKSSWVLILCEGYVSNPKQERSSYFINLNVFLSFFLLLGCCVRGLGNVECKQTPWRGKTCSLEQRRTREREDSSWNHDFLVELLLVCMVKKRTPERAWQEWKAKMI